MKTSSQSNPVNRIQAGSALKGFSFPPRPALGIRLPIVVSGNTVHLVFQCFCKRGYLFMWNIDLDATLEAPHLKYLFVFLLRVSMNSASYEILKCTGSCILGDSSFPISKKASLRFNFTATPEIPEHYQNDLENPTLLRDLTCTPW